MKQEVYIPKNPNRPPAQDFDFLRQEGLNYIQNLGHRLWTDYNIHDPGITILEVLCYAITDLSYKTSFSIPDLLASGKQVNKSFFTAREILVSNPVTINDYRKLLIDIEGIKNAWIFQVKDYSPLLYADCKKSKLCHEHEKPSGNPPVVSIKGLYDISLEMDTLAGIGDLNDYSFLIASDNNRLEFSLPAWDELYKENIDPAKIKEVKLIYDSAEAKNRIHHITVEFHRNSGAIYSSAGKVNATAFIEEADVKKILTKINNNKTELKEPYLSRITKALEVAAEVYRTLHNHRNLAEDFRNLGNIEVEDIVVCADIEVDAGTEIEEVRAEIAHRINGYLAPSVNFYTLQEMLDGGHTTSEIFNGPALTHGFITNEELDASELRQQVQVSDLIRLIMDIEGVVAVKKIMVSSLYQGMPVQKDEKWWLPITPGRAPRQNIERSKITFYKNGIPYYANQQQWQEVLEHKQLYERSGKTGALAYDLPIPKGTGYDLLSYQSIQNDLPKTYGTGSRGIPGLVDEKRRAKAKQLKAYLLIYDQILANYLAQLSAAGEMLNFDEKTSQTFFSQLLYSAPSDENIFSAKEEVPEVYKLIESFIAGIPDEDIDKPGSYRPQWETFKNNLANDFVKSLQSITENTASFERRRNLFLDHLLSRFSEKFTDYVLLMYRLNGKKPDSEVIKDKVRFLQDYPVISRDRGKSFNYTLAGKLWNTDNVSGFEKRLARLTGIDNYNRRYLQCKEPEVNYSIFKDVANEWRFNIKDDKENVLLKSEGYTVKASAKKGLKSVFVNGIDFSNYRLKHAVNDKFYYNLHAKNGEIIGTSIIYLTKKERDADLASLVKILRNDCDEEGFHLVEHMLLRPHKTGDPLMEVCLEPGCKSCEGNLDPYSFRLTLVLPAWTDRFMNMSFRAYFEKTARLECPAHLHLKICWVSLEDMITFEKAWKNWLKINAEINADIDKRREKLAALLSSLVALNSVFPIATLHDCEESEDENPVLLGKTILGSSNTPNHE